jgi:hypothetical protein
MLVSLEKKFIFIHVYKVAGTSIKKALEPYCYTPQKIWYNRLLLKATKSLYNKPLMFDPKGIGEYLIQHGGHIKAQEAKNDLPSLWANSFTFAFVRNPWDWQVSLYNFMKKDKSHFQHQLANSFQDFKEYLQWRVNNEVRFQTDFLLDRSGNLIVDFIGRLETINDDFSLICNNLGISASLPKVNVSNILPYQEFYDSEDRELVAKVFAKDINLLGYSFDSFEPRPVKSLIGKCSKISEY